MAQTGAQLIQEALTAIDDKHDRSALAHFIVGWLSDGLPIEKAQEILDAYPAGAS